MGLSRFLRRADSEPRASAFDAVSDDARQLIANDICAMIECIKAWKAAVNSPEHAKAMWDEAKAVLRGIGGKLVTSAMTGNLDADNIDLAFIESLNIPPAILDIIKRVKAGVTPYRCQSTDQINHETGERVQCELSDGHSEPHRHQLAPNSFVEWKATNGPQT